MQAYLSFDKIFEETKFHRGEQTGVWENANQYLGGKVAALSAS